MESQSSNKETNDPSRAWIAVVNGRTIVGYGEPPIGPPDPGICEVCGNCLSFDPMEQIEGPRCVMADPNRDFPGFVMVHARCGEDAGFAHLYC